MRFNCLKVYTSRLQSALDFYTKTLGFELKDQGSDAFTVRVGYSDLTFERSEQEHRYHYCFLIPSNQLHLALAWLEARTEVIAIEGDRKIERFDKWNADTFYFYDGCGNIGEMIVRYDLENEAEGEFTPANIVGLNEIGIPTDSIPEINRQLERELGSKFWKGDLEYFGTNGTQKGIFLLPNYQVKKTWFPTSMPVSPEPFDAEVEHNGRKFCLSFRDGKLKTKLLEKE